MGDASNPVCRRHCLCMAVGCGYHAWRHRFEQRKDHDAPIANPVEADALARKPKAPWDKKYRSDPTRCGLDRCLTHLCVVESLLRDVDIDPAATVLDCCGG